MTDRVSDDRRSAERYRLAVLGALATAASRLTAVALMFLTVHWAAPVLSAEQFGIWATFSSLIVAASFLDLGIGNALVNNVAHAVAAGDRQELRSVIMAGLAWLTLVGAAAAFALALASEFVPWSAFFKLGLHAANGAARTAALSFSLLFGLNVVASGFLKVLVGQQKSFEANTISAVAAVIAGPLTWHAVRSGGGVSALLFAGFGTQAAVSIGAVLYLIRRQGLLDIAIAYRSMHRQRRQLLTSGALFFLLQLSTMIGWGGDTLLLAGLTGAADVASFAIAQRLFMFASQPVAVMNGPLWAAYADAHARRDHGFIRRTLRRSLGPSIALGAALAFILFLFGTGLIRYWTDGFVPIQHSLLAAFALWVPFECSGIALSTYLNGVGVVRQQVVVAACFCLVAIPAKVFAVLHFGAPGLVAATTLAYAIVVIGAYLTVYRRTVLAPLESA